MHSEKDTGTEQNQLHPKLCTIHDTLCHTLLCQGQGYVISVGTFFFFYSTKVFTVFHLKEMNAPDVSPLLLIFHVGKSVTFE